MPERKLLRILRKIFVNVRLNQLAQGPNPQGLTLKTTWSSSRTRLRKRWFCTRWRLWRSLLQRRERSSRVRFKLELLALASHLDCWRKPRLQSTWKSLPISRDRHKRWKSNEIFDFIDVCFALFSIYLYQWIFIKIGLFSIQLISLSMNENNNEPVKIINLNSIYKDSHGDV